MKTRLPKALLIAVLAAMTQPGLAEETTTATPDFTSWITKVTPGVIVGTEGDVNISGNAQLPTEWVEAAPEKSDNSNYGYYNKPYLKDGKDTKLIIENVESTFKNPLYIREGAAYINDSNIVINCNPQYSQSVLQVAGNNASLTLTNSTFKKDGSTYFANIGGPDGKGTLNLVNSELMVTTMLVGHSTASAWDNAINVNSTAPGIDGDGRYAGGEYTYSNRGNGVRFFGEATVNVDANSSLVMTEGTLYMGEATINVNGGTISTAAEAPWGYVLGRIIDTNSTLKVTNGGKVTSSGGIQTGDYFDNVDFAGATILVDGKNDKGEASTLKTTGVLELGYGVKNAMSNAEGTGPTTLTVTGGGKVEAGEITLGRDTDANLSNQVQVTVGTGSSIEGTSLNILEGANVSNSGTITVAEDTDIIGGSTTTHAGGVTNFEGNVTVTGGEFATGHSQIPTVQKWRTKGEGYTERRLGASYTGEQVAGGIINFGGDTSVVQIKDATFQSGGEMNFSGSSISVENASFETLAAPDKDTAWSTVSYVPEYYTNADGNYTDSEGNVLADGAEPIVKQYIKTTVKNAYTDGAMSFNGDVVAKSGSTFTATAGEMNFNGSLTAETGSKITSNTDATITMGSLTLNGGSFTSNGELIADTITLSSGELVLGDASTLTLMVDNTAALIFGDAEVLKLATAATMVYVELVINDISTYSLRSASTDLILAEGNEEQVAAFYDLLDNDNVSITYVDTEGNALEGYSVSTNSSGQLVLANETNAVPEPTTATLSLLALAGLCARRRRASL